MEFLGLCLIAGGGMSLPKGVTTSEAAIVSILVTCHKESEWGDRNHTSYVSIFFQSNLYPRAVLQGKCLMADSLTAV